MDFPRKLAANVNSRRALEFLRGVKWAIYPALARLAALYPAEVDDSRLVFLVGCGRSGTTAFGRAISRLPGVHYLNEPLHIWHAIDQSTDAVAFFGYPGRLTLTSSDVTATSRGRARRIFGAIQQLYRRHLVLEKLPTNTLRLFWLHSLFPRARFLSIVRNPIDVIDSISLVAQKNPYRISGKPSLNSWWGVNDHKRKQLLHETSNRFPSLDVCSADVRSCAALEWLLSAAALEEARQSPQLAHLINVVRYEDLVADPVSTLSEVSKWLGLKTEDRAIEAGGLTISGSGSPADLNISLSGFVNYSTDITLLLRNYGRIFGYR